MIENENMRKAFKKQIEKDWKDEDEKEFSMDSTSYFLRPLLDREVEYHLGTYYYDAWVNEQGNPYIERFSVTFWNEGHRVLPKRFKHKDI
jgi:hypothetical protein